MTSVGQSVTAEIASATAPASGWLARVVGLVAVGLALLSAVATFVVLANLTPILPTHEVVLALLLFNGCTILILLAGIPPELWRSCPAPPHRPGGREGRPEGRGGSPPPYPHRDPVLRNRGGSRDPGGGGRERDRRPRP